MTLRITLKFDWIQEPLFQLEAPKDQPPEKDDGIIKPTTLPRGEVDLSVLLHQFLHNFNFQLVITRDKL